MTKYSMNRNDIIRDGPTTSGNSRAAHHEINIAVMGVTGAGKTTFIQHFTPEKLGIGHSLESYGTRFNLVDTPGFDDTYRTDTDVLMEIAGWLSEAYANKISLDGIIYLQRVSDPRVGGSALKNLRMFKRLCGDNSLASVVLATTMWSQTNPDEAVRREQELVSRPEFWKNMVDLGSRVFRQDAGAESAATIIKYLIDRKRPITLDIQVDMVDKKLSLDQTAAGKELEGAIEKQRKVYEAKIEQVKKQMDLAIKMKDEAVKKELADYRAEIEKKLATERMELERMRSSREELRRELQEQHERQRKVYEEELKQSNERILREEYNLKMMQQNHANALRMKEIEMKLEQERAKAAYWKKKKEDECIVM